VGKHGVLIGVKVERFDAVTLVAIDNPPLNLLTQDVRRSLGDVFEALAADDSVRAIVLASRSKHFCAGADMSEFPARFDPEVARAHGLNGQRMVLSIIRCPKPVIAAIDGACMGGGMEISLACDLRVAVAGSKLGLPEIRRGVWPGTGGIFLLTRLVGPAVAKDMVMTGDIFDAGSLQPRGVIDAVAPDGKVLDMAMEKATTLAARPAQSVRAIKTLVDHDFLAAFEAHLRVELEAYVACYQTADAQEGNRAFFEKSDPEWLHR
jgi:enoyl-CoA hydratase/carnithine racemase